MKSWFPYILILALGVLLGRLTVYHRSITGPPIEAARDTLVVIDTQYFSAPAAELEMVIDNSITIVEGDIDTSKAGDLLLPRTQKIYRGESYEAKVSGYQPRLDDIKIFRKSSIETVYRTSYVSAPEKPWSLSFSGAFTLSNFRESINVTPSISAELGYDRRWWGISIIAGFDCALSDGGQQRGPMHFVGGDRQRRLISSMSAGQRPTFMPYVGVEARLNILRF